MTVVDVHLHAFQRLALDDRAKNLVQVRRHGAIRGAVKVFLGRLQRPAENGLLLQAKWQGSTTDLVGEWQSLGTVLPVPAIRGRDFKIQAYLEVRDDGGLGETVRVLVAVCPILVADGGRVAVSRGMKFIILQAVLKMGHNLLASRRVLAVLNLDVVHVGKLVAGVAQKL